MADPTAPKRCLRCNMPIAQKRRGRPRRWCSESCRRRAPEEGIEVREVIVERTVIRPPEPVSVSRQIARILDDPDATEQLLRTLAHRWRHRDPAADPAAHARLAPTVLDIWQAFHAPADPAAAKNPPPKVPTAAAEQRAAVARVLASPRSIREVLMRVREMLDAGQLRGGNAEPVHNGLAYLMRPGRS
ncbi:hypothetical protein D7D52_35965 [Nocardia yunnanensis]|uniref:Uncharacterized protein n=1 Tax=Nocardia yunnanensis TaxID=2382165 RepID=A0A386ZPN6_9NOCA|nr:hypothetical protein [Nocardia yunnanensis]AYF79641.1 hypothetical protein D7D52_35965 [Nocardia yunnanensis]